MSCLRATTGRREVLFPEWKKNQMLTCMHYMFDYYSTQLSFSTTAEPNFITEQQQNYKVLKRHREFGKREETPCARSFGSNDM